MKVKSYFAATVEAAMNMARLELGSDAMLVSTKRTGEESRHLGQYEVVFAAAGRQQAHATQEQASTLPVKRQSMDRLSEEVAAIKREMERLASALTRSTAGFAQAAAHPEIAGLFSTLLEAELDPGIAQEVVSRICSKVDNSGAPQAGLAPRLAAELSRMFHVDARMPGEGRNAIALVGPPGAGKTTTLVKLAVHYGLASRRPSQILSLDTHRVASTEPLRSYAAITGLCFRPLQTPHSLWEALEECRAKNIVLIDTPGLGSAEREDAEDLARLLSRHPKMETHLVLNAATKPADLNRFAEWYSIFAPTKLIFTHLDETATFGPLLNIAIGTGKPISFLAWGQQIPEDLEPAAAGRITELVIGGARSGARQMSTTAAA